MAKLSPETAKTIWDLQHQLLEIIHMARTLEMSLFEAFGETEDTIPFLDELQSIAQQAIDRFSLLCKLESSMPNLLFPLIF